MSRIVLNSGNLRRLSYGNLHGGTPPGRHPSPVIYGDHEDIGGALQVGSRNFQFMYPVCQLALVVWRCYAIICRFALASAIFLRFRCDLILLTFDLYRSLKLSVLYGHSHSSNYLEN